MMPFKGRRLPQHYEARTSRTARRPRRRQSLSIEPLETRHLLAFGNVFLTGHDTLDHGGQNGYDSAILDFLRGAGTANEIPAAEYSLAVLGTGSARYQFSEGGTEKPGYEATHFFDTDALVSGSASWHDVLNHDALIVTSLGTGNLDQRGMVALNQQAAAIANAIDAGLDVWANSSGGGNEYYDFLSEIVPITPRQFGGSSGFSLTPAGVALLGVGTDMLDFPTHNAFEPNPALTVLEMNGGDIISVTTGRIGVEGRVWHDANQNGLQDDGEDGVAGTSVRLLDEQLAPVDVTTTDAAGGYELFTTRPGIYTVEFVPVDLTLSPRDAGLDDAVDSDVDSITGRTATLDLSYDETLPRIDAGVYGSAGPSSVGSRIWQETTVNGIRDTGENGLGGVTVNLWDAAGNLAATDVSEPDGSYGFAGLTAGLYTLEFIEPEGFKFTQQDAGLDDAFDSDVDPETFRTAPFSLLGGQDDDSRSAGLLGVHSVGDRVWHDINGNGIQEIDEPGLADVTVRLLDLSGRIVDSTVTDADGVYELRALAGDYVVEVVPNGAYQFSLQGQGDDEMLDSDVDPSTGRSDVFSIPTEDIETSVDAGLAQVELAITEFMAINRSGLQDMFGNNSDWIEIANTGAIAAQLDGWYLTDRMANLKWRFPEKLLAPGEYLVVFASGYYETGDELHADFKLTSSGEYLGLIAPDGVTVVSEFAPTYGQQVPDVSYGRDDAGQLLFYTQPTPGAPNEGGVVQVPFNLVITEFMAENHGTIADEDGDFPDWIEVHNAGQTAVVLNGWYLTDSPWDLTRWEFPRVTLDPGAYIVVFASGNDRDDKDAELHTNFKLSSVGEYLALVDPDGTTVVSEYEFDAQQSDVSYGLSTDFRSQRFFAAPTPGARNTEDYLGVAFSHRHGFYDLPIELALTTETAGAVIRFTTDGSEPSATSGEVYIGPITIDQTTTLRATAILPGETSTVFTQTYLFVDDILTQTGDGFPATWGFLPDYQMDPEVVEDPVYHDRLIEGLQAIPSISIVADLDDLFSIPDGIYSNPMFSGPDWTRAVSFELIDHEGRPGLQANAALSIEHQVGSVRPPDTPKLPLRLAFDEAYGPSTVSFPSFSGSTAGSVDGLVLHAGYEDSWIHPDGELRGAAQYTRDQWLRDTQAAMGQPALAGGFVHLYVNGLYWGLYNAVEAPTAFVAARHLGGDAAEYDLLTQSEVISGDRQAWETLVGLARGNVTNAAQYNAVQQYLDVENLIDFVILDNYAGNHADSEFGWYAVRRRAAGAGFQFFAWDGEAILDVACCDPLATHAPLDDATPRELFNLLMESEPFRQSVADRLQFHLFNGGALDPAVAVERFTSYDLAAPLVAESARWGDYRRDGHSFETGPFELMTVNDQWQTEQDRLRADYFPVTGQAVVDRFRAEGLYPPIDAPQFGQHGGIVPVGHEVAIEASAGTIYYTLDGTDPRGANGNVSISARQYDAAMPIDVSTQISARALAGGQWSALTEATFLVDQPPPLVITEIMYHPEEPTQEETDAGFTEDDQFEYIELRNDGDRTMALSGIRFTQGIDFSFAGSEVTSLAPGEHVVVVKNRAAFEARYGTSINVAGEYGGQLNNGGELITLLGSFDETIVATGYGDDESLTDGNGFSLVQVTDGYYGDFEASAFRGGSPGEGDPFLAPGSIVINEVMAFPLDSPNGDWIELHNTTDEPIDIGGWFLSDSPNNLANFQIPDDTVLLAGGFAVFYQTEFGFGLKREGEEVFLSSGRDGELGGYRESIAYERAEAGVSFGRFVFSSGDHEFLRLSTPTLESANSTPFVGPVVINEVMYNPPVGDDEYIELLNISDDDVLLDGWRLTAIDYPFPNGTVISAHGYLLVVSDDPQHFLSHHPLPVEVPVLGPFTSGVSLDNGGESITLYQPDDNGEVRADRLVYDDDAPWTVLADSLGASLSRLDPNVYGNDVTNWSASNGGGTPGMPNQSVAHQARTFPYMDGFETQTIDTLAGWDFAVSGLGAWEVTGDGDPFAGMFHLRSTQTVEAPASQEAVLLVDLSNQAGRTDLALDFYVQLYGDGGDTGSVTVEVSGDGGAWTTWGQFSPDVQHYTNYAFDLDFALMAAGIALDENVFIKFRHDGNSSAQAMTLDNVRVSDLDFFPPNVIAQEPLGTTAGPFRRFQVTFDDPIDLATFSPADVSVITPSGGVIVPDSVSSDDMLTWTVEFAPQTLAGTYQLSVGPNLADVAGNLMSQGGSAIDGQTVARNPYVGSVEIGPPSPQPYPHSEDFEAGDITGLSGWSFATSGTGTWDVTAANAPIDGAYHLRASQVAAGRSSQEAVLVADLSSQSEAGDLSLDFWVTRSGHNAGNFGVLSVSGDAVTWANVYGLAPRVGDATHFVFDLDWLLTDKGISVDDDVYIRFQHTGNFANDELFLDRVRIGNADLVGPTAVLQSPTGTVAGPVDGVTVTFSEPIDLATFTAADVTAVDPVGNVIAIDGEPIDSGNGQTFSIPFAESQVLAGTYLLRIGPDLSDAAGNPMNQDGDPNNGETNGNDTFTGTFRIGPPVARAFPHSEGFEADAPTSLTGWEFSVSGSGTWQLTSAGDPHAGMYHLRASQTDDGISTEEAVLVMDLSGQSEAAEIYLDFWSRGDGATSEGRVLISGDGREWTWLGNITLGDGVEVYHAFDLGKALTDAAIEADGDVYIQFVHKGSVAGDKTSFDDIRVSNIDPFGPVVLSHTPLVDEGDVSRFDVTFDEPIDATTFAPEDVSMTLPGAIVPIISVTTTDNLTFTITLSSARLGGLYDLSIGPNIVGMNGIPMNQDGDSINGELNGEDAYVGTLFVPVTPVPVPYFQGFEAGDLSSLAGWTFRAEGEYSWGGGDWRLVSDRNPFAGNYHLRATQHADCWTQHDAVLALDTSAFDAGSDLVLEFYMQRISGNNKSGGGRNMGKLLVSDDGVNWTQVGAAETLIDTSEDLLTDLDGDGTLDLVPPLNNYTHYQFDFDAMLAQAGLAVGSTLYLDIHRLGFYSDDITTWDNISVHPKEDAAPETAVIGRHILYGNSALVGAAAIAADKTPMLPGEPASAANITSYSRGINGVVIDVAAGVLPAGGSRLNAADFRFRVSDDGGPTRWTYAPAPTDITVETGLDGVDHVTITWPDYAIRNQWLQVTMLSTADSGLAVDDVFYIGNLPGDGNGDGSVDGSDFNFWNNDRFTFGDESPADFNRDGAVDVSDLNVWLEFRFTSLSLNVTAAAAARAPRSALADVVLAASGSWNGGDEAESFPSDVAAPAVVNDTLVLAKAAGQERLSVDALMPTYRPHDGVRTRIVEDLFSRLGIGQASKTTLHHMAGEHHAERAVEGEKSERRSNRRRMTGHDARQVISDRQTAGDNGHRNGIRDLLFAGK